MCVFFIFHILGKGKLKTGCFKWRGLCANVKCAGVLKKSKLINSTSYSNSMADSIVFMIKLQLHSFRAVYKE